jgi:hypothetical protein
MKDMRSAVSCKGGIAKVGVDDSQPYCYREGRESSDEAFGVFVKQIFKGLELLLELGNIRHGKGERDCRVCESEVAIALGDAKGSRVTGGNGALRRMPIII